MLDSDIDGDEVFTGKPVWEASSLAELFEKRQHTPTPTPSSHVVDLDPAVERVIQRCLEADPAKRPSSAASVAARRTAPMVSATTSRI